MKFMFDFRKKNVFILFYKKCMYICKWFWVYVCEVISVCIFRNVILILKYLLFDLIFVI